MLRLVGLTLRATPSAPIWWLRQFNDSFTVCARRYSSKPATTKTLESEGLLVVVSDHFKSKN